MDLVSAIYALIIAILGFATLAIIFNPKNIMMMTNGKKYKIPIAAIILIVIIIVVGILWAIRHHRLKSEAACY
jgi:heme/copper-type cytochrome/quinol oxidase subunit 4